MKEQSYEQEQQDEAQKLHAERAAKLIEEKEQLEKAYDVDISTMQTTCDHVGKHPLDKDKDRVLEAAKSGRNVEEGDIETVEVGNDVVQISKARAAAGLVGGAADIEVEEDKPASKVYNAAKEAGLLPEPEDDDGQQEFDETGAPKKKTKKKK